MNALSTPTHNTTEIKKQKKGKEEGTHPNDQKPMKSQNRVI